MKIKINSDSFIEADDIKIGENVRWGRNIDIKIRGIFSIGDNSVVGDRFFARGENIKIGKYFFNVPTDSRGMNIGGGSSGLPYANLTIGDRCTCHTGHINLARPVEIGDDVGISHDVDILTHGSWSTVLEGYPSAFKHVKIGNNVILGWKSIILPGVEIANNVVVGSNSTVTKSLSNERAIYVGSPAVEIKKIKSPNLNKRKLIVAKIIEDFKNLLSFYEYEECNISCESYPILKINNLKINVENFEFTGYHDDVTDAFRDFIRRYGIRVFCARGFQNILKRK